MIIKNGQVVTPGQILYGYDVYIKGDKIQAIDKNIQIPGEPELDAENKYVCPGFVDIHTHGGYGGDFMDATDESYEKALHFHGENGTTSILTSSVTAPVEDIRTMLAKTREYMKKPVSICRVLGAHVEGPYISYKNKGAQKAEYLRVPAKDSYDFITDNADIVKNVTISTELEGAVEMTKELTSLGIVVSGGHDDGLSETAYPVIEAGMTNLTHWYCAMSTAKVVEGKRSVGLMEIGLLDSRLTLELIADNHHLPRELVQLAYRNKGPEKLCLVSDCLRAGGMPADGTVYMLGTSKEESTTKFRVADGVARLLDGTRFAGSIQSVRQMVHNLVWDCNIPLVDAVRMGSLTPATVIGKQDLIGSLEVGKKADVVLLNQNLDVIKTIIDGQAVYGKEE